MGLVSKAKLEDLGLDGQFPSTVHGARRRRVYHRRSREGSSPSMVPNQHCCLTRQPYDDFPRIFIYARSVFLLMARIISFFSHFV